MEGKLRKRDEHYFFWSSDWNPDKEEGFVANTTNLLPTKLSIKNCQSIENGYDLDELVNRAFDNMGYHSTVTPHEEKQFKLGYKIAFREALEILSDKKFSEKDMGKLHNMIMANIVVRPYQNVYDPVPTEKYINSLQQTEWDVEIEMENSLTNGYKNQPDDVYGFIAEYKSVPKLDADGCLILRRK